MADFLAGGYDFVVVATPKMSDRIVVRLVTARNPVLVEDTAGTGRRIPFCALPTRKLAKRACAVAEQYQFQPITPRGGRSIQLIGQL
jgi:hypothetical protein